MANKPLGTVIPVNDRGAWLGNVIYFANDVVQYNGIYYQATSHNLNTTPPTAPWTEYSTTGGHLTSSGSVVAASAGANNGTSPPAPVVTGTNDARGKITFGSGTTPAAGAQVTVTFAVAFGAVPVVLLTANNSATQALGLYVSSVSTSGFTISSANAPTASQANTIYSVAFGVLG